MVAAADRHLTHHLKNKRTNAPCARALGAEGDAELLPCRLGGRVRGGDLLGQPLGICQQLAEHRLAGGGLGHGDVVHRVPASGRRVATRDKDRGADRLSKSEREAGEGARYI